MGLFKKVYDSNKELEKCRSKIEQLENTKQEIIQQYQQHGAAHQKELYQGVWH